MKVISRKKVFDHGHGLPPGQLVRVDAERALSAPSIRILAYSDDDFHEIEAATLDRFASNWVNGRSAGFRSPGAPTRG